MAHTDNNAGNNYAMKWKTSEERKRICALLCKHLSEGFHQDMFEEADWDTVERYMKDFPEDFPSDQITHAKRLGYKFLYHLGLKGTAGELKGRFNDKSWKFIMQNKYAWKERHDFTSDDEKLESPIIMKPPRREDDE